MGILTRDGGIEYEDHPRYFKKGEWLFLKNQDMYEDLLNMRCVKEHLYGIRTHSLFALVALKLLAIHQMKVRLEKAKVFISTLKKATEINAGTRLVNDALAVGEVLGRYLERPGTFTVEKYEDELKGQERQLNGIFEYMEMKNEFLLKAMMCPEPIVKMPPPQQYTIGSLEEIYSDVQIWWKMFLRLPDMKKYLMPYVGTETPSFH